MSSTSHFTKGDIIKGDKDSEAEHPIIYIGEIDEVFFLGGMLSTKSRSGKNIRLRPNHIKDTDEHERPFEIVYRNSYLVFKKLLKREEWQPFVKVGELTLLGVEFVENVFENLPEETF